jgi:hypothetical protein
MGKQNTSGYAGAIVSEEELNSLQKKPSTSGYSSSTATPSSGASSSAYGGATVSPDVLYQKKNDTASSGAVSSSVGSGKRNEGAQSENFVMKFLHGIDHATDGFYAGVYDLAGIAMTDAAFMMDALRPQNWIPTAKIIGNNIIQSFEDEFKLYADSGDAKEMEKQRKMSYSQLKEYSDKRYDAPIDPKAYGFKASKATDFGVLSQAIGNVYNAGTATQEMGDVAFKQTLEQSGIDKKDIEKMYSPEGKGIIDFISEGKYADAATIASISAARTIPMSIALASSGGTAEIFAGSALMGAGSELNKAYKDDQSFSGSEIVKAGWSGLIEGMTETMFQTNLKELKKFGSAIIGSPLADAVARDGAEEVSRQIVRGMLPTAKKIFRGAGEEGLEEIISTVGNFIVDKSLSENQTVTWKEIADLSKRAGDAFIIGSLSGGVVSGSLALATSNKLDETQIKTIKRLQEVVDNTSLTEETRQIAKQQIEEITKYQDRGAYDNYTKVAAIEDVEKRGRAISSLYQIDSLLEDKKSVKDENLQKNIDEGIQEHTNNVNALLEEQWNKEIDRHPEALKARMADAKIKAKDFLENNNAYSVFQQEHADTMRAVELGKEVEVSDLNKATDQLHEVEQVIHNSNELSPLEKDAALYKVNGQIRNLETYINATENGVRLTEAQTEGRRATTGARALERARRVRNNRFKGEVFTAFDEKGNPFQVTAQVNEKGQISLKPKTKYRVNVETKEAVEVDNSIKIKGDLEVIDKKENEDNDITEIRVRDNKTGKEFTTNSPVLIPMLMANQAKREGKYAPDRAYIVDENIQIAEANPILNKLTKEQRARIFANYKALQEINPNARIIIFDNATEIQRALMEKGYSRKEAVQKSRTSNALKVGDDIFVNRMSMQDNTIPHEIFHHAFSEIAKQFPEAFIKMQQRIMMVLPDKVSARLQQFADLYADNAEKATDEERIEMAEEFMMELGAMMTVRDAQIQRGWVHKAMLAIRELLSKYASKLKLNGLANLINNNIFSESAKIEDLAKFFESLSESIQKGGKADLTYLENELEQNKMMAARQVEVTPEQEQEDIDSLNEDFAGELYEPTNLNITGTINQDVPESKRKPKKPKEGAKEQKRGDFTLMPHPIVSKSMLVGKRYSVTMSDHTKVGEYRNEKTGVHIKNLMGGVFYPYIQGIRDAGLGWASVTPDKARALIMNAKGQEYTLVYRMARATGAMGNHNFMEVAFSELIAPVANNKVSEQEFLLELNKQLNKVVSGRALLSKYGTDTGKKTKVVSTKGGVKSVSEVPVREIKSIDDLQAGLAKESFSSRGNFWSTLLKDSWNKGANTPWYKFLAEHQVASLEDIVQGLAESETDEANDHDVVAVLKINEPEYDDNGNVKVYTTRKNLVNEKKGIYFIDAPDHPSYPYVVKGEPVGVLDEFNNVSEYFPVIKKWMDSGRLNSPYKAVETMHKELLSSREKIKAQKQMTPVFHGGEVEDITTLEDDKIFFVANDKEEALAYARDNDGNLIEINIDKSKIAPESEIRKILEDEFGLPYEYMIHELIDPRFEDTYIGDELTSELFNRLEEEGYEGGEFMDSAVTSKSRNTQNMFIINPANTLSNNDYLNITLATQSEAEDLLEEGYRPLLNNGEVMNDATKEDIESLFSTVENLINDSKLQMVKPSEYTKYTQAKEGITAEEAKISEEIEKLAVDSDQLQLQIKPQKILYHGSPWNFNRFEAKAIGIGEGRQVYGYGLYFSTDKKVARSYAMANQGNKFRQLGLLDLFGKDNQSVFGSNNVLRDRAYSLLQNTNTTLAQWKQFLEENKGFLGSRISKENRNRLYQAFGERNLYQVRVDDRANLLSDGFWLDWNKSVGYANAQQILMGIRNAMTNFSKLARAEKDSDQRMVYNDAYNIAEVMVSQFNVQKLSGLSGGDFYTRLTDAFRDTVSYKIKKFDPQQMASTLLSYAGIDGNRVETFNTTGGRNDGHQNYIVFDANAVTIIGKSTIKQQKQLSNNVLNVLSEQIESQERRTGPSIKKAFKGIMNRDLTELRNLNHATYRSLYKYSFDRMVNIRKEMEDSEFNRSMFLMFNKAGASQFGNFKFEKAFKRIYSNLSEDEIKVLDQIIYMRRVIAIDENFDNQRAELEARLNNINQIIANDPSVKDDYVDEIRKLKQEIKEKARPYHGAKGALKWGDKRYVPNKETSTEVLDLVKRDIGDELYNNLLSRSDEYFKEFSNILKYKMENGIITKETYEMFKNYNYSPRKFLDYAFGIEGRDENGNPTGDVLLNSNQFFFRGSILSSEDIKNIKQGSKTDFMITDSRKLLQGAMVMTEVKVATNKMVKALAEDSQLTNQGWVKPMKYQTYNDGTIKTNPDGSYKYYEAEDGYRKMDYWVDGKKYSYQLREDLAREFLDEELRDLRGEEGSLKRKLYDWSTKLSGSQLVRFFATGINTGFFISNIPIDVASQVNVTDIYAGGVAGQYAQAMGGTLEISKRMLRMQAGFEDPYIEKLLQEYAESGGLMMSQTQEAMGKNVRSKLIEYLALFGNISEIASKLNSYRTVKNRLVDEYYNKTKQNPVGDALEAIKEQAAYKARAAMDYHRGGLLSKMWDGYVPYFNVFTQGAFISWKYIKNNKATFFDKISKAGIALAGLTVYNMMVGGDDYDNDDVQMDLLNKIVIFMPWKNEDGTRPYLKISVPSIVKGFLNTYQHIGEGAYYKLIANEPSRQAKWRASVTDRWLKGFTPSPNAFISVPVIKAALEYGFNYDFYKGIPIFNDEGSKAPSIGRQGIDSEKVLELYKIIGIATGLSPVRLQKGVEDIIPALNPLVQMGYSVVDKIVDTHNQMLSDTSDYKLAEYQRSKFGKGDMTAVTLSFFSGIKDRAVDVTDPKYKLPKNKEEYTAADAKRGDVYQDLKADMKQFEANNGTPDQLREKIKDKPFIEQKYAIDYYFMLKKRENLNFEDNFNEYSRIMFSADAKAKAEKLHTFNPLTNYLNPQNEQEKKVASDLIMLNILDPATSFEYQNYYNEPKK